MAIGQLITEHIERLGTKQKAIAAAYIERKRSRGEKVPPMDTVESRLSNLKGGLESGVRYFFSNPQDEADLLEVLEVTGTPREAIVAAASSALSPEDRKLLLAIDLSDRAPAGAGLTQLCERITQAWDRLDGRCVLIVTEAQAPWLVAKFSADPRMVRKVRDAAAGAVAARELAREGLTVASARPVAPLERWVAVDWARATEATLFFPSDSIESLRAGRAIDTPDPGAAKRPAARILPTLPEQRVEIPRELRESPARLRKLVVALRDARPVEITPTRDHWGQMCDPEPVPLGVRRAWGIELGLDDVAATPDEWLSELQKRAEKLGTRTFSVGHGTSLEAHRRRVAHGAPGRCVRAGDVLHLLNVDQAVRADLDGCEGVVVETVEPRACELTMLREHLHDQPEGALFDDPTAGTLRAGMLERGAQPDATDLALRIVWTEHARVAPSPLREGWWEALAEAVAAARSNAPIAGVRVPHSLDGGFVCFEGRDSTVEDGVAPPSLAPVRVTRDGSFRLARPVVVLAQDDRVYERGCASPVDVEGFLTLLDRLRGSESDGATMRRLARTVANNWHVAHVGAGLPAIAASSIPLEIDAGFWPALDRDLGMLFLALSRAVARRSVMQLSPERALIELDGRIAVELRQWPRAAGSSALEVDVCAHPDLRQDIQQPRHRHDQARQRSMEARIDMRSVICGPALVEPHMLYQHRNGPLSLRPVYLAHRDSRFVLEFYANPWAP